MNKKIIFLVDDDLSYLEYLKIYLSKYDLNIEVYSKGSDCVNNLYKSPDVVILDFYLDDPNTLYPNGSVVFLELKKRSPATKVIILSNQDSGDIVFELMGQGIKNYIEKNEKVFDNLDEMLKSFEII